MQPEKAAEMVRTLSARYDELKSEFLSVDDNGKSALVHLDRLPTGPEIVGLLFETIEALGYGGDEVTFPID